ncbi:WD repeat-containing protein 6 isoform X1 [Nylanderia fulva]|uniref:WD repeat-containing protein 6 isoform X1 n=1 Tax=Nylanderia fulva TaxID=613905 RepID=UPI0010FB797C|nr:WD repeat-containing protein 6 isoform X1 [Nylanderia fulva]
MMISRLSRTNVLAIRCLEDLVLVGMGPTLWVFEHSKFCENYELKEKLDCLYPNNIHGIVVGPNNKLAVFGAKSICICNIVNQRGEITFVKQSTDQLNDWIIAVEWISIKEQMQLAILFAHNYLCIYNILDKSTQVVHCTEKCILYGGSISGTCQENLVIFSGTVFQEILIWKIDNNYDINERMPVLHRLIGHKGVIFSVIYDSCSRLICSTSDDRSVRFWRMIKNENPESNNLNWKTAKIIPVKTMFVHSARVWKAVIRDNIVVTIGEDSLICTWSLSGNLLSKAHHGSPIWSIDISKDNKKIFTGGADGSVYMWQTAHHINPKIISLSTNDTHNNPKCISYLRNGTLLIFDENGMLFCYDKEKMLHTKYSLCSEIHRSYYIMQVSSDRSFVAFASREGYVIIYQADFVTGYVHRIIEERIMESQIFSLHWLGYTSLIACGANGLLKMFTIEGRIHINTQFILPSSRERWLTAATIYKQLLVCGDRAGNVYVYKLNEQANGNIEKPVQIFNRVHGKIGVQSFAIWEEKLMTTGRDGILRFYELSKDDTKPLLMLHKKKMPIDWISGMLKSADGHCTPFILGFKEVEFIIYNLSTESILIRVPCGGGHRSWDCMILDETTSFIYIQNKQIYVFDYPLSSASSPILQNGFHTKETYCLQHISKLGLFKQDIFISGGEDCTLRVSSICELFKNNPHSVFHNLGNFDGHLSGIKCISTVKLKETDLSSKYLVFSGGGRAQLKIWEIRLKDKDWISSNDLSCSDLKSHMLYGQDQYRRKSWQESKQSYIIEPETRYMDICTYYSSKNANHVLIFIACADGYLRLFLYNIKTNDICLKVSTKYIDRCILKMYILLHKSKVVILTMTTDGILRFFNFTDTISKIYKDANIENQDIIDFNDSPFSELSLHQSGINSFDLKHMDEDRYLLVTGGDDNLLNLVCFQLCISENNILSLLTLSKWNTATAHSAQITGLKFKDDDQICSVGIDQQVIIHSYSWSHGVISANILNQVFTSVTDVQGMDLWPSNDSVLCIYGRGFEVLSI